MKKNSLTSRLNLDRQTVRLLTAPETAAVHGGEAGTSLTLVTLTKVSTTTLSSLTTLIHSASC